MNSVPQQQQEQGLCSNVYCIFYWFSVDYISFIIKVLY